MDVNKIKSMLPEHPRQGMYDDVASERGNELGPEFALFSREAVTVYPDEYLYARTITPEMVDKYEKQIRRVWGAAVKCTYCGEEYYAGYHSDSGVRGISIAEGEDGTTYSGYVEFDEEDIHQLEVFPGETFMCPYCGEVVELVERNKLRHGRTYQVQVCSVENIERYTALVFWMVSRHVDEQGIYRNKITPCEALVIDENGQLRRYSHVEKYMHGVQKLMGRWEPRSKFSDSFQSKYYDWPSICHNKIGGMCWKSVPDLTGKTGEKTGLAEYIKAGGEWPAIYLKTWRKYKGIENLLKSGWHNAVITAISEKMSTAIAYRWDIKKAIEFNWGYMDECKPFRMLGVTKSEARFGDQWAWCDEMMTEWWYYRNTENHCSAEIFNNFYKSVGLNGVKQLNACLEQDLVGFEIPKLLNYFARFPDLKPSDTFQYLIDVRDMAQKIGEGNLTVEHLWPKNLVALHDRLEQTLRVESDHKERMKYAQGFEEIYKKYKDLEWDDGELCVRLPRHNGELVAEGTILRHCVGGYGENHISGKDVIFFVRHYRRPERSYYTLDIRFSAGKPYEVQLHGYGNERHGPNKQYVHKIPFKVRRFVDTWKRDVLMQWYADQKTASRSSLRKECKMKEIVA